MEGPEVSQDILDLVALTIAATSLSILTIAEEQGMISQENVDKLEDDLPSRIRMMQSIQAILGTEGYDMGLDQGQMQKDLEEYLRDHSDEK